MYIRDNMSLCHAEDFTDKELKKQTLFFQVLDLIRKLEQIILTFFSFLHDWRFLQGVLLLCDVFSDPRGGAVAL